MSVSSSGQDVGRLVVSADDGPGVARISHRDDVAAITRRGADIERVVLARAVQWHCEDRVLRDGATTVVF